MTDQREDIQQQIDALLKEFESNDDSTHYFARDRLIEIGQRNLDALIKNLSRPEFYKRAVVVEILGAIGGETVYLALLEALNDSEPIVRSKAALGLNSLVDNRAVEPLINALKDENYVVRRWAADILGKLSDMRAVEPLYAVAVMDKDEWARLHSAKSLAKLKDHRAQELLEKLKESAYEGSVKASASQALYELKKAQ